MAKAPRAPRQMELKFGAVRKRKKALPVPEAQREHPLLSEARERFHYLPPEIEASFRDTRRLQNMGRVLQNEIRDTEIEIKGQWDWVRKNELQQDLSGSRKRLGIVKFFLEKL